VHSPNTEAPAGTTALVPPFVRIRRHADSAPGLFSAPSLPREAARFGAESRGTTAGMRCPPWDAPPGNRTPNLLIKRHSDGLSGHGRSRNHATESVSARVRPPRELTRLLPRLLDHLARALCTSGTRRWE
jgi:hypothetical protein